MQALHLVLLTLKTWGCARKYLEALSGRLSTLTRKDWNCGSKPSRSSLTLLKNAFIVTICF